MERTNEAKLREIIVMEASRETFNAPDLLACKIADTRSELVLAWARDKLGAFIRVVLKPKREPNPLQQYLPGFEQVPRAQQLTLERKLPLAGGKLRALGECTVLQIREAIKTLEARASKKLEPQLGWLQDLANQMSPYSEKFYVRGNPVTVARYCELVKEHTPAPVVRSTEERSEAARRRWANRPKKARSAQAKKAAATVRGRRGA